MLMLRLDPAWPADTPPDLDLAQKAGRGVGGRRYHRLAAAGPWGDTLFIKDFGSGTAARRAARREFDLAAKLRARGGPCPRPWGVAASAGRFLLLSEDCGEDSSLARLQVLAEPELLAAVARSVAALHAAGGLHGDLHLGNLLRTPGGALLWTDLRNLRLAPGHSEEKNIRDLGRLAAALEPLPPRSLLGLARAYLQARTGRVPDPRACKATARTVDREASRRLREHHDNLDRRARRQVLGFHPAVWRDDSLRSLEFRMEEALDESTELKRSGRSRVMRVKLAGGRSVVVKHFQVTRPMDPRNRMGRSKALINLLNAEGLRRRGFGAARPLAAWSRPGAGSWLILEDLPRHLRLHDLLQELDEQEKMALIRELALTLRRMHRLGVAYRDLKPSNILVDPEGAPGERICFVDHDRNRFRVHPVPPAIARRDLAALHAGLPPVVRATERLRALRVYDPTWTRKEFWMAQIRPLLAEAAARRHRWVPRALLGAGARTATEQSRS